jgi:hypothetical protein
MTHRAAVCICIFGSFVGFLSVPLLVVCSMKLPTRVSAEEQRTLNIQDQSALLNQRLFASEGWKYCVAGFSFLGLGILSLGCILVYICVLRIRAVIAPDNSETARTLHAIVPRPTRSSSTTDGPPQTSSASLPGIRLELPV